MDESEIKETFNSLKWILENLELLDLPDQLYVVSIMMHSAETIKPIYEKYTNMKIVINGDNLK